MSTNTSNDFDVIVVGAGGDGPACAQRLGERGLNVLVLEAGPWYGNEKWPRPTESGGKAKVSSDPEDLSGELLDEQFTTREAEMLEKLVWGPADIERPLWYREQPEDGLILQVAGVGGTTLHYTGCHPRAYPSAFETGGAAAGGEGWEKAGVGYEDLAVMGPGPDGPQEEGKSYYRTVEDQLDISPAPTTPKEELYYQGASNMGFDLLEGRDVEAEGYRPQPNAITRPDGKLNANKGKNPDDYSADSVSGHTLVGTEIPGNPHPRGADYADKAKKSSAIGFVPEALETGNVTIRPNAFVTEVLPEGGPGSIQARGVRFRDTWTGDSRIVEADAVVLAAGAIETPRLWLNSPLPRNEWVGRGLTIHFGEVIVGQFSKKALEGVIGQEQIDPWAGEQIAARFDWPGYGGVQTFGGAPGTTALSSVSGSAQTFTSDILEDVGVEADPSEPWDTRGRIAGEELKRFMGGYDRMLSLQIMTDDEPQKRNRVELGGYADEHGAVPKVTYTPSADDIEKRNELSRRCADILRSAVPDGLDPDEHVHVHRLDAGPSAIHIHSTMRMGFVADGNCEAYDVDRLFIADHSVLPNGLGGPNPTNTGQALAMRTGDRIADLYFED
ncbi:GMC oxidoreductase [Haloglomus salinum]|jgi:choline dehydrogenase-like flavoprotein|uniref:GMC oxidoreductase n=1 Tax=Haloglomus salinum TaxID=2962673 RepID=UPI0020CA1307|nr:GMC oxidoreductase [Haloglomus salinum]